MNDDVEVYRNLHTNTYSLRREGLVVDHPSRVSIVLPRFSVQPAGRDKVRATRRKNVHAFVRGTLNPWEPIPPHASRVHYNPYNNDTFVVTGGTPIYAAEKAWLDQDFRMWAVGVR